MDLDFRIRVGDGVAVINRRKQRCLGKRIAVLGDVQRHGGAISQLPHHAHPAGSHGENGEGCITLAKQHFSFRQRLLAQR